jgi:23S rRNA (cytosine1962-C5)-methyltransferase
VRLYVRDRSAHVDRAFFAERIEHAILRRAALGLPSPDTNAYRLVHAEGDGLPGLIVDRFDDVLAIQIGTIGMKRREALVLEELVRALAPRAIVDRTSLRTAKLEGFEPGAGIVRGDSTLRDLEFFELGLRYRIPLELGQKTGFYLDQRPLRERVAVLAAERRVLDAFAYVGAVAMAAARGGAREVHALDTSEPSIQVLAANASLNGLGDRIRFERADAYELLASPDSRAAYDLVICDPPKLAPTRAKKTRALQSMRRLAAAGCRATRPGGLLALSSCSAAIGLEELTRAAALGARDVGLKPLVIERLFQGPDHPVPAAFPEGLYLSTLILEVVSP